MTDEIHGIFNFQTLAERFRSHPYEFFVEKDVQRRVEFEILRILESKNLKNELLHQEYPMPVKNKGEVTETSKKGRPHLDLAVLNPDFLSKAKLTPWHPNLQDNKASLELEIGLKDNVVNPWIDHGIEFKFFRFAATEISSKAAGLTSSKFHEIIWDLEKLIHYTQSNQGRKPLIREAWLAIFEEVGSDCDLPGICDENKVNFSTIEGKLEEQPRKEIKKMILNEIKKIQSNTSLARRLKVNNWIVSKVFNVNIGYCWRKAEIALPQDNGTAKGKLPPLA